HVVYGRVKASHQDGPPKRMVSITVVDDVGPRPTSDLSNSDNVGGCKSCTGDRHSSDVCVDTRPGGQQGEGTPHKSPPTHGAGPCAPSRPCSPPYSPSPPPLPCQPRRSRRSLRGRTRSTPCPPPTASSSMSPRSPMSGTRQAIRRS